MTTLYYYLCDFMAGHETLFLLNLHMTEMDFHLFEFWIVQGFI